VTASVRGAQRATMVVERDVRIPMADGITLAADARAAQRLSTDPPRRRH
jgi:predicted acyl esterase